LPPRRATARGTTGIASNLFVTNEFGYRLGPRWIASI
jgi:hypothetical protein